MAFKREHFREEFFALPAWACPRCETGALHGQLSDITNVWPTWSKKEQDEDWWEPEHIRQRFSAQLICNNPACGECVFVIGEGRTEQFDDHEHGRHYSDAFRPRAAYPAIPIFRLKVEWPEPVSAGLRRSFHSLWSDPDASANSLRISVESLLDHLGVNKTQLVTKGGKTARVRLTAHARIKLYEAANAKVASLLLAIKWLGNAGSHASLTGISRNDVLDGMEIMEHVLHLLFDKSEAAVVKLATKINKTKGPAKAKKKKFGP